MRITNQFFWCESPPKNAPTASKNEGGMPYLLSVIVCYCYCVVVIVCISKS